MLHVRHDLLAKSVSVALFYILLLSIPQISQPNVKTENIFSNIWRFHLGFLMRKFKMQLKNSGWKRAYSDYSQGMLQTTVAG